MEHGSDGTLLRLRSPEDLMDEGFGRSLVVMVNEAHDGSRRCVGHRVIGQRLVRRAHHLGVRRLAMEALWPRVASAIATSRTVPVADADEIGYVSQPEMRELVEVALGLGWEVVGYEARIEDCPPEIRSEDLRSTAFTEWRESEQSRHLTTIAESGRPLLVWCGMGHLQKLPMGDHHPMGWHFIRDSGIEHFAVDQVATTLRPVHLQDATVVVS